MYAIKGGELSAAVIIVGNGIDDSNSIPERGSLFFSSHLSPWASHNQSVLPAPSIGQ